MENNNGFDRSAYKATSVSTLKKEEEKVKELTGSQFGDRVSYLKLKKGKNKIRIFPAHPETTSFCYARTVHFLELESKDKDGKPIKDDNNRIEIKRRPTFNAKVHGVFPEKTAPIDIIDDYIQRVFKKAHEQFQDDAQRKNYLSTLTYWKTGITGKTKWIVYANLYDENGIPEFGRLEIPTTVKDKLNEISANQDGDGMMMVDPFTDPDEGRIIFVTYNPDEKDPKKKYTAAIDYVKPTPLTDDELGKFAEQDSLQSLFVECYTNKDFTNAIEGLKRFDDNSVHLLRAIGFDQGYDIFADEAFLDVCEKVAGYFPVKFTDAAESNSFVDDIESAPSNNIFKKKNEQAAAAQEPFVAQEVAFEDMTDLDQLSAYVARNGVDVTILPDDDVVDVIQAIKDEIVDAGGDSTEAEEVAPKRKARGERSTNLD